MRIFRCNFANFSREHASGLHWNGRAFDRFVTSHDIDKTLPPVGNFLRTPLLVVLVILVISAISAVLAILAILVFLEI